VSEVSQLAALRDDALDVDQIHRAAVPVGEAIRRRLDGRYPIDPFGYDPHLVDFVTPAFSSLLRVEVTGGENLPKTGPAVLIANRGFGIAEPAVLGLAVRRTVQRRLRITGAPQLPALGGVARRLGAISASAADLRACLSDGHLVAVPLAPTWLRSGAGVPPRALMLAMTHVPIIPVAVTPGGPFGLAIRPWRVRFGSLVTLADPYDPDDPLAAARFAEAVRDAVSELLVEARTA
jgi:1-acyl-sn-glycerol-3-phosphate acyltransferase